VKKRRNRHQKGLTNAHYRLRRQLEPVVASGSVRCARCGELIEPGEPWDLDHNDLDRTKYNGPAHARCNRATSSHHVERKVSRQWL